MKRKEKPSHSKLTPTGEVTTLEAGSRIMTNGGSPGADSPYIESPYTEYIPLHYLLCGKMNHGSPANVGMRENFLNSWTKRFGKVKAGINNVKTVVGDITQWLLWDEPYNLKFDYSHVWRVGSRATALSNINLSNCYYSNQRTYSMGHTPYSLYLREDGYDRLDANYNPHVLAVVLPENYLYMKYRILVDGVIDLSKVIILVDRELDTTSFKVPTFRKFYREKLQKEIMKTNCDVWEVPAEFIKSKCFIPQFTMKGIKLEERRKLKAELIESFIKWWKEGPTEDPFLSRITYRDTTEWTWATGNMTGFTSTSGSTAPGGYSAGIDPIDLGVDRSSFEVRVQNPRTTTLWTSPEGAASFNAAMEQSFAQHLILGRTAIHASDTAIGIDRHRLGEVIERSLSVDDEDEIV